AGLFGVKEKAQFVDARGFGVAQHHLRGRYPRHGSDLVADLNLVERPRCACCHHVIHSSLSTQIFFSGERTICRSRSRVTALPLLSFIVASRTIITSGPLRPVFSYASAIFAETV